MTLVRTPRSDRAARAVIWNPAADIVENNDGFSITMDVPGFTRDDFSIKIHEGVLRVSGERKKSDAGSASHFTYYERPYGTFERSFRIPDFIDAEKVKGIYRDGVLTIELQKKEEAKPHVIAVE